MCGKTPSCYRVFRNHDHDHAHAHAHVHVAAADPCIGRRRKTPQLAPAVQFQLALAGALSGWQYGLIAAVSPLAEGEDAKDLLFDKEVEDIRAAAAAKAGANAAAAAAAAVPDAGEKAKERALAA